MEFKFIAVNGDNVGDSIGSAIATDNHEELSKITGGLKDAHGAIDQWIESVGGEIVTSSGDEGIYKIPAEAYDEATIDSLRSQYSESTGTTITVGIGASMSEASKALIYGKLNDKDQVVEYDPHVDDYIAGHDEEVVDDEEVPEHEQHLDEEGKAIHDATENETDEEEIYEEDMAQVGEESLAGPDDENMEYQDEVPEMEETALEGEAPIGETDEAMPEGEFDETLAQEGEMSEDDLDVNPEDRLEQVVGDLDGDGDVDAMIPEEGQIDVAAEAEELPEVGGEFGDEDAPEMAAGPEGMMPEEGMEELPEEGMEAGMPGEEDLEDNQSALTDMIHANMGEDGEEMPEEEGDNEELRDDIASSLMTFKENKQMLEQAKQENPKLYEATILMLRSMIEMAKKLNMDPEADVEEQMAMDEMPDAAEEFGEELPEEEEAVEDSPEDEAVQEEMDSEDALESQEVEEEANENDKKKGNPFAKNEMVSLYSNLMKGTAVLQRAEKQYWRRELKEREQKEKEARRPKKAKGAGKGKKVKNQKPVDAALAEVERKMKVSQRKSRSKK